MPCRHEASRGRRPCWRRASRRAVARSAKAKKGWALPAGGGPGRASETAFPFGQARQWYQWPASKPSCHQHRTAGDGQDDRRHRVCVAVGVRQSGHRLTRIMHAPFLDVAKCRAPDVSSQGSFYPANEPGRMVPAAAACCCARAHGGSRLPRLPCRTGRAWWMFTDRYCLE